ncbi:hypothetical protein [Hyphomicrobium sp. LHD-15]|uniref:hypothetical protein n=1 Tax=Hyphomicrobium sp. LHD-15 TaxID=3072142 RepID=UPI0028105764|nr:hypothetical protein [Hyphomicrobium sp. LHD-15]MDQ8699015.1 hypothetical protein [Hyphomicrobium sp. LHD-15]
MESARQTGSMGGVPGWMPSKDAGGYEPLVRGDSDGLGVWTSLLWPMLGLSGMLNGLQLSVSLYVIGIYDHVLPTRSLTALALLTGAVLALHVLFALLDWLRSLALFQASACFLRVLDGYALGVICTGAPRRGLAAVRDVERVGRFLIGGGPAAFLDVLWTPIFLGAVFWLNPALGSFAGAGFLLVAGLGIAAERRSRGTARRISRKHYLRFAVARDAEAAKASRSRVPVSQVSSRWSAASRSYYVHRSRGALRAMQSAALGKALRLMFLSGGLALGALLFIEGAMSAGGLVASSVLMGRLFMSLDAALMHWRSFVGARTSYTRLVTKTRS